MITIDHNKSYQSILMVISYLTVSDLERSNSGQTNIKVFVRHIVTTVHISHRKSYQSCLTSDYTFSDLDRSHPDRA